jgi:hypothetical protein
MPVVVGCGLCDNRKELPRVLNTFRLSLKSETCKAFIQLMRLAAHFSVIFLSWLFNNAVDIDTT